MRDFTNFELLPLDKSFVLNIENALVGQILTTKSDKPPRNIDFARYPYMGDAHVEELDDDTMGVILDARYAHTWVTDDYRSNSELEPICLKTKWGYTMIGPSPEKSDEDIEPDVSVCLLNNQELSFQQEVRRMFRADFIMPEHEAYPHEQTHPSVRDEFSRKQMEDSIVLDPETGHYKVVLPWMEGQAEAARKLSSVPSYQNAYARLMKEKYKFQQDPARKEGTFKQIADTLAEGHARVVTNRCLDGLPVWYMPIHVVTRPDKPGKFRICQDAASKVQGTCLNEHLCKGPDLLNSITGVLMRFRLHPVAFSADIKNFFHMIYVTDKDVAALHFLFFKDETMKEIDILESLVHIFGASSSPPVANFVLRYHAERIRSKYGDEIFWQIIQQFYVDDYLSSFKLKKREKCVLN